MAACLSNLHQNILIEVLCPFLDQVSLFRLARCSKTLYEKLKRHLPKREVLRYFNWTFKSENIETCWKLARKRHESGKWCLGGCGKQRAPMKHEFGRLVIYGRARTQKDPLNICKACSEKRHVYLDIDRDLSILDSVKRLKRDIERRNVTDPFLKTLQEYEDEETLRSSRLTGVRVGDVLIPKYQSYGKNKLPDLKVVEVRDSFYVSKNKADTIYVMEDDSYICSVDGKRFENWGHDVYDVYVKPPQ